MVSAKVVLPPCLRPAWDLRFCRGWVNSRFMKIPLLVLLLAVNASAVPVYHVTMTLEGLATDIPDALVEGPKVVLGDGLTWDGLSGGFAVVGSLDRFFRVSRAEDGSYLWWDVGVLRDAPVSLTAPAWISDGSLVWLGVESVPDGGLGLAWVLGILLCMKRPLLWWRGA